MHSFFLCCVVYVGRYDEGFSLKSFLPLNEWPVLFLMQLSLITPCASVVASGDRAQQQNASKQSKHFEILILNQVYISQTSSHKRVIHLMQCFLFQQHFLHPEIAWCHIPLHLYLLCSSPEEGDTE